MRRREWTEEELNLLKSGKYTALQLSHRIDWSITSIYTKNTLLGGGYLKGTKKKKETWSKEELKLIKSGKYTTEELVSKLFRSPTAVRLKKRELKAAGKLKEKPSKPEFTPAQIEMILSDEYSGKEIAEKLNCSMAKVYRYRNLYRNKDIKWTSEQLALLKSGKYEAKELKELTGIPIYAIYAKNQELGHKYLRQGHGVWTRAELKLLTSGKYTAQELSKLTKHSVSAIYRKNELLGGNYLNRKMSKKLIDKLVPLNEKDLLKVIKESVKEQGINEEIIAVYLTGSRLRNLHNADSDYDVYVITKPSRENLLSGKHLSTQINLNEPYKIDLHCLDVLQLRQELLKGSINMLEMLVSEPIYLEDSDFIRLTTLNLVDINPEKTIKSLLGMAKSVSKSIEKGKRLKDASLLVHFTNLMRQYMSQGKIADVEAEINVKEWRKHVKKTEELLASDTLTEKNKEAIKLTEKGKFEESINELEQIKELLQKTNRKENKKVKESLDAIVWKICKK